MEALIDPRIALAAMVEKEPAVSMYLAEFIGTYMLVFTVGCNVLDGNPVWAATSIASVLMVCIYALGNVSGANFNPAVSVACVLSGAITWFNCAVYIVVQLVAGILAGYTYYTLYGATFTLGPASGYTWVSAGTVEFFYSFMLCFVVLNTACCKLPPSAGNQYFGLAIGFVIVAGGYAVGGISGGAFNPAVAFGIDVPHSGLKLGYCLTYTGFEFAGAIMAAAAFRAVRPGEFGNERRMPQLMCKLIAEFLGTFFLVLTVGFNVLTSSKAPAFSIAASLMCMIYALGHVSGAHFNPAVTFAILLSGRGKITLKDASMYVPAQILGGISAGLVYSTVTGRAFALGPVGTYTWSHASAAEIVFTFVLCFVVLNVATTQAPSKDMFGLAIGSCVTVGGFAVGAISGGSLNPAVSLGIDIAHSVRDGGLPYACLAYSALELVGGAVAAGVFRATRPTEFSKDLPQFSKKLSKRAPLEFFIGDDIHEDA